MTDIKKLSHTAWECKYHVVFIPRFRKRVLYAELKNILGPLFHDLAHQRESRIVEGRICVDHVHMMIEIPPKYSVAHVVGFIKGKSSIYIARYYQNRKNVRGHGFWARGYYVNTVGRDEEQVRKYIKHQQDEEERLNQLGLDLR